MKCSSEINFMGLALLQSCRRRHWTFSEPLRMCGEGEDELRRGRTDCGHSYLPSCFHLPPPSRGTTTTRHIGIDDDDDGGGQEEASRRRSQLSTVVFLLCCRCRRRRRRLRLRQRSFISPPTASYVVRAGDGGTRFQASFLRRRQSGSDRKEGEVDQ